MRVVYCSFLPRVAVPSTVVLGDGAIKLAGARAKPQISDRGEHGDNIFWAP